MSMTIPLCMVVPCVQCQIRQATFPFCEATDNHTRLSGIGSAIEFNVPERARRVFRVSRTCLEGYVLGERLIAEGEQGVLVDVCTATDESGCGGLYVAKLMALSEAWGIGRREWNREVAISEAASRIGVGPLVVKSGECTSEDGTPVGVLIMERLDRSLKDYLLDLSVHWPSDHELEAIYATTRRLFQTLKDHGYTHKDLHPGNLMYKRGPPRLWYIIDFGLADEEGALSAYGQEDVIQEMTSNVQAIREDRLEQEGKETSLNTEDRGEKSK